MNKTAKNSDQNRSVRAENGNSSCFKYIHRIRGNYLGDYTVCISQLICHAQSEIDDGEVKESVTKYISVSLYIYIYIDCICSPINLILLRLMVPIFYKFEQ